VDFGERLKGVKKVEQKRKKHGYFRKRRSDRGKARRGDVSKETRQRQSEAKQKAWKERKPKKYHRVVP